MSSRAPPAFNRQRTIVQQSSGSQPRRTQPDSSTLAHPGRPLSGHAANGRRNNGGSPRRDSGADGSSSGSGSHRYFGNYPSSRSGHSPFNGPSTPPPLERRTAQAVVPSSVRSSRGTQHSSNSGTSAGTESLSSGSEQSAHGSGSPDDATHSEYDDDEPAGSSEGPEGRGVQLNDEPIYSEVTNVAARLLADPVTIEEAMEQKQKIQDLLHGFKLGREKNMARIVKLIDYRDHTYDMEGKLMVEKGRIAMIQDKLSRAKNPEDAEKRDYNEWKQMNTRTRR